MGIDGSSRSPRNVEGWLPVPFTTFGAIEDNYETLGEFRRDNLSGDGYVLDDGAYVMPLPQSGGFARE